MSTDANLKNNNRVWVSLADRLNPNRTAYDADFKSQWKQMSKKKRKRIIQADRMSIQQLKSRSDVTLPFDVEPDDHCEASPTAYDHIPPL